MAPKVRERSSEPNSANEIVNVSVGNIFPSNPSRVKSGKKTMMMIAMPKTMGRPASFAAWSTVSTLPA